MLVFIECVVTLTLHSSTQLRFCIRLHSLSLGIIYLGRWLANDPLDFSQELQRRISHWVRFLGGVQSCYPVPLAMARLMTHGHAFLIWVTWPQLLPGGWCFVTVVWLKGRRRPSVEDESLAPPTALPQGPMCWLSIFCFWYLSPLGTERSWHSLHVFGNRLLCTIAIGLSVLAWPHTWGSTLVSGSLKVSLLIEGYHLRPLLQEWRRGRIYLVYHPEVEADVLVPSQNSYVTSFLLWLHITVTWGVKMESWHPRHFDLVLRDGGHGHCCVLCISKAP